MQELRVQVPLGALATVPNGRSLQPSSMGRAPDLNSGCCGFDSRGKHQRFCDLHGLLIRVWESLAFRVLREHEIAGSNPAILTDKTMRWVLCWYGKAAVNRRDAGSIPASAASYQRKGKPIGDGSRFESGRAMSLEGSTPSPSAELQTRALGRAARLQASNLARRVRFPQSTLQMIGSVAQRQSRCLLSTSARVRVPPVPL